ncbi:hypothetical protein V8E54_008249 [Elaphomyces granulatus]
MPRYPPGNAHDWTKEALISYFQLSEEEYRECRDFLGDFLAESGLLGKNFKTNSTRLIEHSLREKLRTKADNEVPRTILNNLDSYDGMGGLLGLSMKINNEHIRQEKKRKSIREQERDQQSQQSEYEGPQPSSPLSSAKAASSRWTKGQLMSHFQLSEIEYEECGDFLEHFLTESGLLGKDFRKAGTQVIECALKETLRTKDHSEVPSAILNGSTSLNGMRGLVGFLLKINTNYVRRRERKESYPGLADRLPPLFPSADRDSSIQLPDKIPNHLQRSGSPILPPDTNAQSQILAHLQTSSLEDCTIFVDNWVYRGRHSLTSVIHVLKDGASQPMTHQDLDFCRWIAILRMECGFDEAYHSLMYYSPTITMPDHYFEFRDESSWQAAILEMANSGLTRFVFYMEYSGAVFNAN